MYCPESPVLVPYGHFFLSIFILYGPHNLSCFCMALYSSVWPRKFLLYGPLRDFRVLLILAIAKNIWINLNSVICHCLYFRAPSLHNISIIVWYFTFRINCKYWCLGNTGIIKVNFNFINKILQIFKVPSHQIQK